MQILIATTNPGKKKEMMSFFKGIKGVEWLSLADLDKKIEDVEEYGEEFSVNALIKAEHYAKASGMVTIAEDSGLRLGAFPDKFGVRTRREISAKDDVDWLTQFLSMMEGQKDRSASFFSAMALCAPEKSQTHVIVGQTDGQIVEFPASPLEKGIPVSAVFVPSGQSDVYSAMTTAQKNKLSHRGKSASLMLEYIEKSVISKNE